MRLSPVQMFALMQVGRDDVGAAYVGGGLCAALNQLFAQPHFLSLSEGGQTTAFVPCSGIDVQSSDPGKSPRGHHLFWPDGEKGVYELSRQLALSGQGTYEREGGMVEPVTMLRYHQIKDLPYDDARALVQVNELRVGEVFRDCTWMGRAPVRTVDVRSTLETLRILNTLMQTPSMDECPHGTRRYLKLRPALGSRHG